MLTVDYVIAAYNILMIGVWLPLLGTSGIARWMALVHFLALSLPLLLSRAPVERPVWMRALVDLYPVLWLGVFWRELGIHWEMVGSAPNDAFIAWLDRAAFGVNLSALWAPAMPMGWLSETMQFVYFSYYALFAGLAVVLLLRRNQAITQDLTLRLSIAYAAAYAVYAVAPTVGPMAMAMFPRFGGEGAHGLFRALNDCLQANGDAAGTAFPSTHTAGAVTLAWLAWRYCPRWVAWAATILAIGIAPATVYTQNHFAVDAICGALLGLWLQTYVVPRLQDGIRWPARALERAPDAA